MKYYNKQILKVIVLRLVTTRKPPVALQKQNKWAQRALYKACLFLRKYNATAYVINTPGGFLRYRLPLEDYACGVKSDSAEFKQISRDLECYVRCIFTTDIKQELRSVARYITLGIDVHDEKVPVRGKHAEYIATYDIRAGKFIYWTGKSDPYYSQVSNLIYCMNWSSHFQYWRGRRVLVLGCHDLNLFNPRSVALVTSRSYKGKATKYFHSRTKTFKPTLVLQHPHTTDSSRIWTNGWLGIRRLLPTLKTYASGIRYGDNKRSNLKAVLESTRQGKVLDFVITNK